MGKSLFSACFGATKAVVDAERGTSTLPQHVERPPVTQLQLGEVQKWTPREVQHWLASVGLGEHAYNLEGMAGQELLELTETDVQARVPASKPAAKLTKAVQHLQRTWLQVTPAGPQPLSTSDEGTKVTILRGTASGVINVPIDSAKPSDSIKASWGPTSPSEIIAASSQFEQNASVALPSRLEAELAAERAVTEALAKDLSWYQTVIDNPLAGSRSLAGSTNTSPGAGATGHTMARSASMALAAQAAAAAAVKRQPSPLTPASLASPSHATHDYTPGSLAGSVSISRELPIPETLTSRRAELDGSQQIAGGLEAGMSHQHSEVWQETSGDGSTALPLPNSTAQGSFLTADSLEPQALVDSHAQSQDTREQNVQSGSTRYGKQDRWQLPGLTASDAFKPEDWQNFCTKVDALQQPGGGDAGPGDADVLQDRTDRAESFLNRSRHDADAAQEEYVKSLVTRFERSVGPAWPARQATPRSGALGTADKENTEAVQASGKTMG
ncbi:hypothetical protein ABBQ38_010520 [Trebouxia sp. C0009 RCD-2024]